jgi:hypothetical protein
MSVLYTSTTLQNFTYYSESFDYSLAVSLATNRQLANNQNFMSNRSILRTNLDSAKQSIEEALDIFAAQKCLDNAKYLVDNPNLFN